MLNQVVLVGRLTKDVEVMELESGKKLSYIVLAVQRPFKNTDGLYEADFIRCVMWNVIAQNAKEYCHVGDVVGIKGRIQTENYEDSEGNVKYATDVVVERMTFLSSSKNSDIKQEVSEEESQG